MAGEYVYILSDHHEYGADHVTATLDRDKLMAMVAANWPPNDGDPLEREERRWRRWIADAQAGLERLLAQSDEDLARETGGHSCQDDWGGMQLHVVRLV